MSVKCNKILLITSITGDIIGGAEKRYLSLFNHIIRERKDYFLVVNRKLYLNLLKNKVLESFDNVKVLTLLGENKLKDIVSQDDIAQTGHVSKIDGKNKADKKVSRVRFFLGQWKMFFKSLLIWLTFVKEFRKVLRELNCNLVYAIFTGGMYAWPLKKLLGFKLIYGFNDAELIATYKTIFQIFNYSEYWVLKYADRLDFLSPAVVDIYKLKMGNINKDRYTITPNSFVNYDMYYSAPQKENNVVFLSRLLDAKNPILFLQSIKYFIEKHPERNDIKFYIIGDGELEVEIKEYIKTNNLYNTYFVGKSMEPWKYLSRSKVFMSLQFPTNYPSQSLMEAMACENAIIASDVGETRMLVTENEGILVELNAKQIAEAIYKLFSTEGLIEKLGKNARKKVTTEQTIEKFTEYFYSITDNQNLIYEQKK